MFHAFRTHLFASFNLFVCGGLILVACLSRPGIAADLTSAGTAIVGVEYQSKANPYSRAFRIQRPVPVAPDGQPQPPRNESLFPDVFLGQMNQPTNTTATGFWFGESQFVMTVLPDAIPDKEITIILHDQSRHAAKRVAWQPRSGLVVLQLKDAAEETPPVGLEVSGSPVEWSQAVTALSHWTPGNPALASGQVATKPEFDAALGCIAYELDAIVRPGASGGPVLDADGRVVGVVKAARSSTGSEGSGIVIDQSNVHELAQFVISGETGAMPAAMLGVALNTAKQPVQIAQLLEDSPARESGLEAGDVVLSIDGLPTLSASDLQSAVARRRPGDTIKLRVKRGEETLDLSIKLGTRPEQPVNEPQVQWVEPGQIISPIVPQDFKGKTFRPQDMQKWLKKLEEQGALLPQPVPPNGNLPRNFSVPQDISKQLEQLSEQLRKLSEPFEGDGEQESPRAEEKPPEQ